MILRLCVMVLCVLSAVPADAADWKDALRRDIEARFALAKLTLLRDDIAEPGTVFVLAQPRIPADRDASIATEIQIDPTIAAGTPPSSVETPGGPGRPFAVTLSQLQPVYITAVQVSGHRVFIQIATSARFVSEAIDRRGINAFAAARAIKGDLVNRVDVSIRRATLVFDFGPRDLRTTPLTTVLAAIEMVLIRGDDPRLPQFGKVTIGMSRENVLLNMGVPVNVVSLGARELLIYDRIKVTLEHDQVVDVQ